MFRFMGDLLSPGGDRARLIVLIYHRMLAAPDPVLHDEIDAVTFERQIALLRSEFNVLPLDEACERFARGALPPRAAAITFDDGYADNEQIAMPILKRHGLCATFFVSTGFSNGSVMFNDAIIEAVRSAPSGFYELAPLGLPDVLLQDTASRRAALNSLIDRIKYRTVAERQAIVARLADALGSSPARDLMMTPSQIANLHSQGMQIGAHTVNHPILMSLSDDEARAEIVSSKRTLEEITGSRVTLFAYPNGKPRKDYGPQHVRLVRDAGFRAAVSTIPAVAYPGSDPFQLPRLGPWDRNPHRLGIRLLLACARAGSEQANSSPVRA